MERTRPAKGRLPTYNGNMKQAERKNRYRRLLPAALAVGALAIFPAEGASPDRYAASSRLSSGKWTRVKVTDEGMHIITAAQLRNMGFSDPSKVRVYGYGGRVISEVLDDKQPDDLPMLPSIATSRGVVFYSSGMIQWMPSQPGGMTYSRRRNPYSSAGYYFISDCDQGDNTPETLPEVTPVRQATSFLEHLLHEKELAPPHNTGSILLGEDFRTQTSQTFEFDLPGNTGEPVIADINFATYTSNGSSSIIVTANGKRLPATTSDQLRAVNDASTFMVATSSEKTIEDAGDKLELNIKYNPGGALRMARLDYITVEYQRELRMNGAEFIFDDDARDATEYTISGCPESVVVWDVTSPAAPKRVTGSLNGDKYSFTAPAGYRRYIAFAPEKVTRAAAAAGRVANQDIHAMEVPDMLIITPEQYVTEANRLADLHREDDGMVVHVLTPQVLYNEFSSGTPDVSAFRKAMKMWYDRGNNGGERKLNYCLIMAKPTYDNLGVVAGTNSIPRIPYWESEAGYTENSSYGTDDFIAMLEDNKGYFNIGREKISVGIGRLPVRNLEEARTAVDKIYSYTRKPTLGSWRNRVVLLADDQDDAVHMKQSDDVYRRMRTSGNGADFNYERLYIDSYPSQISSASNSGYHYPEAKSHLMQLFDDGIFFFNYIGHASPHGLTGDNMFNWTDINSMTNRNWPFMYMATCEFLRWDADALSGAEIMWHYPKAGAIAMIAATRSVYISLNGVLSNIAAKELFARGADGKAKRIGDFYRDTKNGMTSTDDNKLRYALMGDPAMRLASPEYHVQVDEIDGSDVSSTGSFPTITASDKVTVRGRIVDADGNTVDDFNGFIETTLWDAETVVETFGNGKEGTPYIYNDRKSRLFASKEPVANGQWTATLLTPSIISNNYSPALLNMYAWSDAGREANGSCERLYVYGVNENETPDENPPVIENVTLNGDGFKNGDIVNESPVLRASMRDEESGINVFGGTIGQQITVKVDDKVYTNVGDYYQPAAGDPYGGSILFPLEAVEPGDHTMTLQVFDNAGNSSAVEMQFRVAIGRNPVIYDVVTDCNPATTAVTFTLTHDRPSEVLECTIEVFDLGGKKVWSRSESSGNGYDSSLAMQWNLCDGTGARVPRGIYLYRATITTAEGMTTSKTRKLAVTAQ